MFFLLRYGKLLPSLQAQQFSAATGLSRMLIIVGAIEPVLKNVSEEVIQRQVRIALTASRHLKSQKLCSLNGGFKVLRLHL